MHRAPEERSSLPPLPYPPQPPEPDEHGNRNKEHQPERVEVPETPVQLRQVPRAVGREVHAVDARNPGQGNEYCRDDGQDLHHLVHAVALAGKQDVDEAGGYLAVNLDGVNQLDGVVVAVAEEHARLH